LKNVSTGFDCIAEKKQRQKQRKIKHFKVRYKNSDANTLCMV
jgi:hypothetical protein